MITDSKINKVQAKIKKAIAEIAATENVSITFGGISYNSAYYTTQMKVTTLEKNQKVTNVYEGVCKGLGFTQNIIGMSFTGTNGTYIITEIKTRNRKYPIIAESSNGKSYKFSVPSVKKSLGGDAQINRSANLDKLVK